jgi:predicted Zn-dependent protease with MMP-like domain
VLEELGIEDAYELTGLYDGIPLTEKSVMDQATAPDVIWLFRRPILDEWVDRGNVGLGELVAHVMVHELAHHFGWSDEDIAAIDPWWE